MGERKKGGEAKKSKAEWPIIKSKTNLRITRLKDFDLFTVPNALTPAESKAFIRAAELIGFAHQGSLGPTKGEAYRDNHRISVNDPNLANAIWESGLHKLFDDFRIRGKVAVGLNPNIRFYRYSVGQRFGRHIDESADLGDGKRTYYTLLIYLSGSGGVAPNKSTPKPKAKPSSKNDANNTQEESACEHPLVGGETVFYGPRNNLVAEVTPTEGMALFHIHGDMCMLHEARNVSKGVKYVLRSDVAFA